MRETLTFALELLISPSKALRRLQGPDAALTQSLILYFIFLLASVAFYSWKPESFPLPDPDAPQLLLGPGTHGLLFWTEVQLWEPVLAGIWIVFLAALSGFFQSTFAALPVQIALATFAGISPAVLLVLHRKHMFPGFALGLFWIVLIGIFYSFLKRRNGNEWKALTSFTLSLNVIDLAMLIPVCLSVTFRSSAAYNVLHYVVLVWTLGLGAYFLSRLDDLSTARAFVAMMLSLVWQLLFVLSLHAMGLVPTEILKGMMSI